MEIALPKVFNTRILDEITVFYTMAQHDERQNVWYY